MQYSPKGKPMLDLPVLDFPDELPPFGETLVIAPYYGSGTAFFGADTSPLTGFVGSSEAGGTSDKSTNGDDANSGSVQRDTGDSDRSTNGD